MKSKIRERKTIAEEEMSKDFRLRAEILADRKELKKYPAYARFFLAATDEARETYKKQAGSMEIQSDINEIIKEAAYKKLFENSRYRKTYYGKNSAKARIRTEDNGKGGWDKVVWHYADYSAILSQDKTKIWVDVGDGGKEYDMLINYAAEIRGKAIKYDAKEKAYIDIAANEEYHTPAFTFEPAAEIFCAALTAFRKRRREKILTAQRQAAMQACKEHPEAIFIQISDSIAAGNCERVTQEFATHIYQKINAQGDCAVRADIILTERNDNYTQRACVYAAMNH